MARYAVVADDLTGASDTGIQLALAGLRTTLTWSHTVMQDTEVLVTSTYSRGIPPAEAYHRVRAALQVVRGQGVTEIFKKIDSTLRGNIGAELDAALDEFIDHWALVCPAFPANGRTVVGGHLLVGGEVVCRTAVRNDPISAVLESYIPAVLTAQSQRPVARVDIRNVAAGVEATAEAMERELLRGTYVLVADAVSDADLETLVAAAAQLGRPVVWVGAAGLARPVAQRWAHAIGAVARSRGSVVVAVGSVHTAARAQLLALQEKTGVPAVVLDLEATLDDRLWPSWLKTTVNQLVRSSDPIDPVIVATPGEPTAVARAESLGVERGLDAGGTARLLASRLAELVGALLDQMYVSGMVLTGGDTATAVLGRIGADGIRLVEEVAPGIPVGKLVGGPYSGLPVVTKAGGFGDRDVLWAAVLHLRQGVGGAV